MVGDSSEAETNAVSEERWRTCTRLQDRVSPWYCCRASCCSSSVVVAPPPVEAITFNDAGFFSEPVATLAPFKPVGVTFAPDGRIFIWQRDGVIRIVKNGVLLPTPFLDISSKVNTYTDHGFLGVALDPNFAANGWVYVFYTYEAGGNPNDTDPQDRPPESGDRRSDQSRRDAGE